MRLRRPKTKTKRCAHCERRRLARFIEWHPGILEWQCTNFDDCDKAIERKRAPTFRRALDAALKDVTKKKAMRR